MRALESCWSRPPCPIKTAPASRSRLLLSLELFAARIQSKSEGLLLSFENHLPPVTQKFFGDSKSLPVGIQIPGLFQLAGRLEPVFRREAGIIEKISPFSLEYSLE